MIYGGAGRSSADSAGAVAQPAEPVLRISIEAGTGHRIDLFDAQGVSIRVVLLTFYN